MTLWMRAESWQSTKKVFVSIYISTDHMWNVFRLENMMSLSKISMICLLNWRGISLRSNWITCLIVFRLVYFIYINKLKCIVCVLDHWVSSVLNMLQMNKMWRWHFGITIMQLHVLLIRAPSKWKIPLNLFRKVGQTLRRSSEKDCLNSYED